MPRVLKADYAKRLTEQKRATRRAQARRFERAAMVARDQHTARMLDLEQAWRRWQDADSEAGGRS